MFFRGLQQVLKSSRGKVAFWSSSRGLTFRSNQAVNAQKQQNQNNRHFSSESQLTVKNARAKIREKNLKQNVQTKTGKKKTTN